MNIYVNEQKIETALNGETQLSQVVDQVQTWIESNGKYVLGLTVDGRELLRKDLETLTPSETQRIDFVVGEELDVIETCLVELDSYIDQVGNTLVGRDSLTERETIDLKEGIPWMEETILSTANLLKLKLELIKPIREGQNVPDIINSLKVTSQNLDSATKIEEFLSYLRDFKIFLMDLTNRFAFNRFSDEDLKEQIIAYLGQYDKVIDDFKAVNENFQSGKDHLANEILNDTINSLNTMISCIVTLQHRHNSIEWDAISIQDKSLSEMTQVLNATLSSIAEALERGDIVFAGDILEYELPDLLEEFKPFLGAILDKLQ